MSGRPGAASPAKPRRYRVPPTIKAWEGLSNVDRAVAQHVGALRDRNVTWARIGEALGMSRQSAWERFSGED